MVEVSLASSADLDDIVDLFYQVDLHYFRDAAPTKEEISRYVRRSLFQPQCGVRVVIAKVDSKPLGIATFSVLYPAPGMTGQLFMKDLFTVRAGRGKGIGKAIMSFLAKLAIQEQCSRFDWTAETTNPEALRFYDHLKIPRVEEKVYYRLTGKRLLEFAEQA